MPPWVLSPLAHSELEGILEHIAQDSGGTAIADKVAGDFTRALNTLTASPGIGWRRKHLTGPPSAGGACTATSCSTTQKPSLYASSASCMELAI